MALLKELKAPPHDRFREPVMPARQLRLFHDGPARPKGAGVEILPQFLTFPRRIGYKRTFRP
jgi:hypothetical protein